MRRRWLALVVLIAAVAAVVFALTRACSGGDATPAPGSQTPTPDIIPKAASEKEKLELTLEVDRDSYHLGDKIDAHASIKNNRADPVSYLSAGPAAPAFRLEVIDPSALGGEQLITPVGGSPPDQGTLDRGAEMKIEGVWDQKLEIPKDAIQAPAGKYSVRATFIASVPGFKDVVTVQTAVTFRLEGGERVLLPLEVLLKAIAAPEFKSWVGQRAQNVICAYPPVGRFYQGFITANDAAETLDLLYANQRDRGLPICGIGTDGDAWRLNFFSKTGPVPNRFNMLFNLHDGSLIRVEEVTPPPSP